MPLGLSANSVCSTYSHTDYVCVFIYKTFVYIIRIRQANQNALHNSKRRERGKQKVTRREQIPYAESKFELNLFLKFNAKLKFSFDVDNVP